MHKRDFLTFWFIPFSIITFLNNDLITWSLHVQVDVKVEKRQSNASTRAHLSALILRRQRLACVIEMETQDFLYSLIHIKIWLLCATRPWEINSIKALSIKAQRRLEKFDVIGDQWSCSIFRRFPYWSTYNSKVCASFYSCCHHR